MASRGRYSLLRKIADGGTAEVFLATMEGSAGFKRLVVLKRVLPKLWQDEQFRRGLIDEAHIAMGLHHSNIVQVLDLGVAGENYFLAFELVDGWTLSQIIKRTTTLGERVPLNLGLHVMAEVCRGLAYAHTRCENGVPLAIVHRDATPQNVLLSEQGEVKLTDFGIARARNRATTSQIGTVKGKPAYMSPEQAQGLPLDARSDLFAVGTMLYQLTTGALPFIGANVQEQMTRVVKAEFEPPNLKCPEMPQELAAIILRALAREAGKRFQSAEEMLHAIEKVQRTVLEPAGQSELKAWLAALAKKDHSLPLSRAGDAQAPAIPLPQEQSVPIELQDEDIVLVTGTGVVGVKAPARRSWPAVLLVAVGLGGAAAWFSQRAHNASPALVIAFDASTALLPETLVFDAGTSANPAALEDAGAAAADSGFEPDAPAMPERLDASPAGLDDAGQVVASLDAAASAPEEATPFDAGAPEPAAPIVRPVAKPVVAKLTQVPIDMVSVLIESEPTGASVRIGQVTFGKTPLPLRLKPGIAFELVVSKPGFRETKVLYFVTRRANQKVRAVVSK